MSKYYIVDSTTKQDGKIPVLIFDNIPAVIKRLEEMCKRQFKLTRTQYMNDSESIGHGSDEPTGRSFYDHMEQYFNIGVIRTGNNPVKTNIFEAEGFLHGREAHGD